MDNNTVKNTGGAGTNLFKSAAAAPLSTLAKTITPEGIYNRGRNLVSGREDATFYGKAVKIKGISGAHVLAVDKAEPEPNKLINITFLTNGVSCIYLIKEELPIPDSLINTPTYNSLVTYYKTAPSLMGNYLTSDVEYDALPASVINGGSFTDENKVKLTEFIDSCRDTANQRQRGGGLTNTENYQVTGGSKSNRRARLTRKRLNR